MKKLYRSYCCLFEVLQAHEAVGRIARDHGLAKLRCPPELAAAQKR